MRGSSLINTGSLESYKNERNQKLKKNRFKKIHTTANAIENRK